MVEVLIRCHYQLGTSPSAAEGDSRVASSSRDQSARRRILSGRSLLQNQEGLATEPSGNDESHLRQKGYAPPRIKEANHSDVLSRKETSSQFPSGTEVTCRRM